MHPLEARGLGCPNTTLNGQETATICSPHPPRAPQAHRGYLCSQMGSRCRAQPPRSPLDQSGATPARLQLLTSGKGGSYLPPSKAQELRINPPPSPLKTLPMHALTAQSYAGATGYLGYGTSYTARESCASCVSQGQDGTCSSHTAWQSSGGSHGHAASSTLSFHGTPVATHPACPQSAPSLVLQQPSHPSSPENLVRVNYGLSQLC